MTARLNTSENQTSPQHTIGWLRYSQNPCSPDDRIPREKRTKRVDTRSQLRANQTREKKIYTLTNHLRYWRSTLKEGSTRCGDGDDDDCSDERLDEPPCNVSGQPTVYLRRKNTEYNPIRDTICPGREPATRVSSKRLYETVRERMWHNNISRRAL